MGTEKDLARGNRDDWKPSNAFWQQSQIAVRTDLRLTGERIEPKTTWLSERQRKRKEKQSKTFQPIPAHLSSKEAIEAYVGVMRKPVPTDEAALKLKEEKTPKEKTDEPSTGTPTLIASESSMTSQTIEKEQKTKTFKPIPAHLQSPEAIETYINSLSSAPKPIEAKPAEARWKPEPSQTPKTETKKTKPILVAATTLSAGMLTQPQTTEPEKTSPPTLLNREDSVIKDGDAFQKTTASLNFKQSQDEEKLNQLITPTHNKKLLALGLDSVAIAAAKRALKWLVSKGANISGHVAKRHVAKYLGKSMFSNGGKYAKDWTIKALKNPDKIVNQGRRIVFEKRFEREVGRGGEKVIRVVVDKATGKIVTAFPTKKFLSMSSVALGIASTKAEKADAQIKDHRKSVENQNQPSFVERAIDLVVGVDSTTRDETHIEEQRIIERNIQEAIKESQKKLKRNLSTSEKQQIREVLLLEMDLTN
jgi:fructose-specific phosphotransferase system component IIB